MSPPTERDGGPAFDLSDRPRLRGHFEVLKSARDALDDELREINVFLRGRWYAGMKAEADRRKDVAYYRFGLGVAHVSRKIAAAMLTTREDTNDAT